MADHIFTRRLHCFLCCLFLAAAGALQAQVDNVYVYGTVKDYTTSKKLDGVNVTVYKDGAKLNSVVTSANGKYEFNLDYGYDYKILYEKPGMVGKNVSINTKGIPDTDRQGGLAMNVEMTLFQDIPGIDFSILQQPIGKSKYDAGTGMLAWDLAYTEQMRAELTRLQKEYDEKKKKEANADVAFQKLMDQGNAAMTGKDYNKAVQSFTDALGLKAGDPVATARLSDAKIKQDEEARAQQRDKQYADLVKEADGLFAKKNYEEAKAKYAAASGVKDQEAYPKQKIKECEAFLADLAAKAEADRKAKELNDKYNAAVAAGDAAFKGAKYEEAKAKFTEAAGLKPDEKYPPQQLAAIAAKLEELAKKAEEDRKAKELDDQYKAAIAAADASFKAAKYEEARTKYNDALGLKPKEKYPTDQLAAIAAKLEELAKKAEDDRKAKELDDQYKAAIAAADAAFKAANYDEARAKYTDALGLKPKEKYPTDQLAAIGKKLEELAAKAEADRKAKELDEQYNAAITAADAAFQQQDYDGAKKKYNDALALKPKEKYPQDQLAAIAKAIADAAKKAEEERLAKERDAKYQALMDKADALFGKTQYAEAKAQYQEASGVKPAEARPKERIAEIDAKLDELARQAEAKRKQDELDAKYAALITSADKKFKDKQHSEALNDYKDAAQLKPAEQYPKDQIAAINALLDANAKEQAEQERLAREKAGKEKQYNDLIAQADKDLKAKAYEAASRGYGSALEVKPGEKYPTDKLAEIQALLKAKADADKLQADKDAAERDRLAAEARRKASADSLKAAQDEAERMRLEAERRGAADVQARYDEAVRRGDAAFKNKTYDPARAAYNDALAIKPAEKYPKDQLAAIEAAIAADLKAKQDASSAAEAARLAEEERLRREAAKADADKAALERARQEKEGQKALDERYNATVLRADNAMGEKDYSTARELYTQALDIKPAETYPQVKIGQIDKLLAEQERQRRERELADQRAAEAPAAPAAKSAADNRKEQEAEEFMREAREREEAEKYLNIKRLRTKVEEQTAKHAAGADERQQAALRKNAEYKGSGEQVYQGSDALSRRNEAELQAFQNEMQERRRQWAQRGVQATDQAAANVQNREADMSQRAVSLNALGNARAQAVEQDQQQWLNGMAAAAAAGKQRTEAAYGRKMEQAEQEGARDQRIAAIVERQAEEVERAKLANEARQKQYADNARLRESGEQGRLATVSPNAQRSSADYSRNQLASQYPQGVTEESYTEGNKVIIKRVVVQGNKADEYSKVIAKWGTFYFKNGQSITEHIWSVNTER